MKNELKEKIRKKLSEIEVKIEKKGSTNYYEGWSEALEWVLSEVEE